MITFSTLSFVRRHTGHESRLPARTLSNHLHRLQVPDWKPRLFDKRLNQTEEVLDHLFDGGMREQVRVVLEVAVLSHRSFDLQRQVELRGVVVHVFRTFSSNAG